MITQADIRKFDLPADVLEHCKANPVPGCPKPVTGQLKALGDWVLRQIVGFEEDAFNMQLEAAREMGVACVCEDQKRRPIGISTTVSLIKDHDVLDKNIIVPAGQIRKHPSLDAHHAVAVFVVGHKENENTLGAVTGLYAAGWIPVFALRQKMENGGGTQFQASNTKLVSAPVTSLNPLHTLMNMVRWHHVCV